MMMLKISYSFVYKTLYVRLNQTIGCDGYQSEIEDLTVYMPRKQLAVLLIGFYLSISEYLLCKLNLKLKYLNIDKTGDNMIKGKSLILQSVRMNDSQYSYNGLSTPTFQLYEAEILTSNLLENEHAYFKGIMFYDWKVWFTLLFFAILNANLRGILSSLRIIVNPFRLFPLFPFNTIVNHINVSNKTAKHLKLIFIIVWLISSTALTKTFSGLLLNVYFKPNQIKVVNHLDDVLTKRDLRVYGSNQSLDCLKTLNGLSDQNYRQLYDRYLQSENRLMERMVRRRDMSRQKIIVGRVLRGNAVVIDGSVPISHLMLNYPESNLVTADSKYFHYYRVFYVSKAFHLYKLIDSKLKTFRECGFIKHFVLANFLIGKLVARSNAINYRRSSSKSSKIHIYEPSHQSPNGYTISKRRKVLMDKDFFSTLLVLSAGYGIAFLVLIYELAKHFNGVYKLNLFRL